MRNPTSGPLITSWLVHGGTSDSGYSGTTSVFSRVRTHASHDRSMYLFIEIVLPHNCYAWQSLRAWPREPSHSRARTFVLRCANLRTALREPSYYVARTFVLQCANLRTVRTFCLTVTFVLTCANLRTTLREPSYYMARTFVLLCANLRTTY